MTITANVTVRVRWHGKPVLTKLQNGANDAAKAGGQVYFEAVTKEFKSAPWGSKPSGDKRIRYRHSSPGQTPFRQTENLANSIRISSSKRVNGQPHLTITRISTRVPYSVTLERGLPQISQPQHLKRFTKIRLKNPLKLKSGTIIAPRPVWLPIFQKNKAKMKAVIISTMRASI